MTLENLSKMHHVAGMKQVKKVIARGDAACVFIADDADEAVTEEMKSLCQSNDVETVENVTMAEIGRASGIDVGSAVAAVLKS